MSSETPEPWSDEPQAVAGHWGWQQAFPHLSLKACVSSVTKPSAFRFHSSPPLTPRTFTNTAQGSCTFSHCWKACREIHAGKDFYFFSSLSRKKKGLEVSFLSFFFSFNPSPVGLLVVNVRFKKKYQLTRQSVLQYKTPFCFVSSSQNQSGAVVTGLWERWVQAPSRVAQNKSPNPSGASSGPVQDAGIGSMQQSYSKGFGYSEFPRWSSRQKGREL